MPDPTTTGTALYGAIAAGVTGGLAGLGSLVRGRGLSDEDRQLLQGLVDSAGKLEQRLVAIEQQVASLGATVAGHREEDADARRTLGELRAQLLRLAEEARPALERWPREQERLGDIEAGARARGARLEEVERQVRAVHERLDGLRDQLREQLPPGLTAALQGLISGTQALRHAIEDRLPRRER